MPSKHTKSFVSAALGISGETQNPFLQSNAVGNTSVFKAGALGVMLDAYFDIPN